MSVEAVYTPPPASQEQVQIIREGYGLLMETLEEPMGELQCSAEISAQQYVIFDVFPFSAGAQRLAFKGAVFERTMPSPTFLFDAVVKLEMAQEDTVTRNLGERTRLEAVEAGCTVRKHEVVTRYVDKWCTLGINKSVSVLPTQQIRVKRGCALSDIDVGKCPVLHHLFKKLALDAVLYEGAVGTVEEFLSGRFTKFLNNDGTSHATVTANFPGAFAHWSWVESKGELMVSDIQGIRSGAGYTLTDPCVHSVGNSEGFGMSDLGMLGVEEFFEKHRCNELCKDLGLGTDAKDLDVGHVLRTRLIGKQGGIGNWKGCLEGAEEGKQDELNGRLTREGRSEFREVAMKVLEESQGKVQRRATMRVSDGRNGVGSLDDDRRRTLPVGEGFGELKRRGRSNRREGQIEGRRKLMMTRFQKLFRLKKE